MAKVKGICRNYDNCDKAAEKEIQEVEKTNFVCEECGKPLYPIEEKKGPKRDFRLPILIAVVLLVIGGIACGIILGIKARNKRLAEIAESQRIQAIQDSIAQVQADSIAAVRLAEEQAAAQAAEQARLDSITEAEAKAKAAKKSTGSIDYGRWSGSWKAGKPNGTGTMRYTKEHLIDSRDPQKRVAKPGDYIIGEFANGKLVQGRWYDSSNNIKGSIIIGM